MEEKAGPSGSRGKSKKSTTKRGLIEDAKLSCDAFPRPRGPMKKCFGKKSPKFLPAKNISSKVVRTKTPSHGRKRMPPKVATAKKRAEKKNYNPNATVKQAEAPSGNSWWKSWFCKNQDDKPVFQEVHEEAMTQRAVKPRTDWKVWSSREVADCSTQTDLRVKKPKWSGS
ncbi:uncharacterized protein LOC108138965 [Drosophila elegans]|uniref:uncharacterized protein LOC108138965 n=1 Tax=Drosophila elegans TaxID=30023 RepID=UPI0007E76AE0|nr:uncharacterized protein LOC108138965 [Drosophila elegans]